MKEKKNILEGMSMKEKMDWLIAQQKGLDAKPARETMRWPFGKKISPGKLARQNMVLVLYLRTNDSLIPTYAKINDGMVNVFGKIYNVNNGTIYHTKGRIPTVVIKEWDIDPIGTKEYYESINKGKSIDPQTVIIRAINQSANQMKPGFAFSGKALVWIFIGGAALVYVFFGGI